MKLTLFLAAAYAAPLVSVLAASDRLPLSFVAISGAPAFDRGADFKNREMIPPVCGRQGTVTFSCAVNYTGTAPQLSVNRYTGVYQGPPSAMQWVNPGGPYLLSGNTYFLPQNVPAINSSGTNLITAAFVTNPAGVFPSISGYGVMRGNGASAQLIYGLGEEMTGLPGVSVSQPQGAGHGVNDDSSNLNDSGRVTVLTTLSGTGVDSTNRSAIFFTDTPGSLTKVVRTGDTAPGGGTFTALSSPATADDGSIAFGARTAGDFFDSAWVRQPIGTLAALAKVGSPIPAAGSGAVCSAVASAPFQIPMRSDGSAAFCASYNSAGQQEKVGVFLGKPGALTAVALDGAPAPGTVGNFFLVGNPTSTATSLRINDLGTVVFVSTWIRQSPYTGGSGIFALRNGVLTPLVLSGAAATGGPAGATFQTFTSDEILLNNRDQLVFQANMTGGGTTSGNQSGFWGLDLDSGKLSLIFRSQETVEVEPGRMVKMSRASAPFRSRGGGSGTGLSDTGRFTFETVSNGSYVILTADFPRAPSRLSTWRQTYFGSPDDSGLGADTAVSSPDGLPNLLHYALGLPPTSDARADGSAPVVSIVPTSGSYRARITFVHDPAANDLNLAAWTSPDLYHWSEGNIYTGSNPAGANPVTTEISRIPLPDGRERITLETLASGAKMFLRLGAKSL